jgi:hypothetical protein
MQHASVEDASLHYEAWTYAWGKPKSMLDLTVQGQNMRVTENL